MNGSYYSNLHAFVAILWCMLGDKSRNVALSSTTFEQVRAKALNIFMTTVHKHCSKVSPTLSHEGLTLPEHSCILAYIMVPAGSQITKCGFVIKILRSNPSESMKNVQVECA